VGVHRFRVQGFLSFIDLASCSLGDAACKNGFMVLYCQMTKLLREISAAQADGSHYKLLNRLSKIRLLILDDWLLYGLSLTQTSDRVFLAT
jgi:DNA replication protein DnaC